MKKLSSVIIAFLLATVALFSIAGCSSDKQSRIDGLQSQIEQMEAKSEEKDKQIRELNEKDELQARIEQLEAKLAETEAKLAEVEKRLEGALSDETINVGLSAYEIYCKNYIYIESEKQWIDNLVAGTLENIDNSILEEKLLWKGTINDRFINNQIILTTDKYFYNKTFTVDDFHMIEVEKVELIANYSQEGVPGYQQYLITIKNKGKQNVINAIRKLEIFAFTYLASPNLLDEPI